MQVIGVVPPVQAGAVHRQAAARGQGHVGKLPLVGPGHVVRQPVARQADRGVGAVAHLDVVVIFPVFIRIQRAVAGHGLVEGQLAGLRRHLPVADHAVGRAGGGLGGGHPLAPGVAALGLVRLGDAEGHAVQHVLGRVQQRQRGVAGLGQPERRVQPVGGAPAVAVDQHEAARGQYHVRKHEGLVEPLIPDQARAVQVHRLRAGVLHLDPARGLARGGGQRQHVVVLRLADAQRLLGLGRPDAQRAEAASVQQPPRRQRQHADQRQEGEEGFAF